MRAVGGGGGGKRKTDKSKVHECAHLLRSRSPPVPPRRQLRRVLTSLTKACRKPPVGKPELWANCWGAFQVAFLSAIPIVRAENCYAMQRRLIQRTKNFHVHSPRLRHLIQRRGCPNRKHHAGTKKSNEI